MQNGGFTLYAAALLHCVFSCVDDRLMHAMQDGPDGASLAKDVQGTWSLQHDPFKLQTILRSLIWPGYQFYYDGTSCTWGAQYNGDGCKNKDLVFML